MRDLRHALSEITTFEWSLVAGCVVALAILAIDVNCLPPSLVGW
jgi:hypothetical protein